MRIQDTGDAIPEALREELLYEQPIFDGRVVDLKHQLIRQSDGRLALRELVRHSGGVAILAVNEDDEIYMVRQFRNAAQKALLEIPAGKLERGEDPRACAVRELREECALKAKSMHSLGRFYPTPGYCSEVIHLYWTQEWDEGEQDLDEGEKLELYRVPLTTALEQVMAGEIQDGKTQIAILKFTYLRARGEL